MKYKKHSIYVAILMFVTFFMISSGTQTVLSKNLSSKKSSRDNKIREQIFSINQALENAISTSNAFSESKQDRIQTLLRQRSDILRQTIRKNPALALEAKLTAPLKARLAKVAGKGEGLLESTGEWHGTLEKLARDNLESGINDTLYYLKSDYGDFEIYFAGETPPTGSLSDIDVSGLLLGNLLAASDWSMDQDLPVSDETDFSCSAIGEQKIAIILVSMPSRQLPDTVTSEIMNETYFGTELSLNSFLQEASYGKAWATGDVVGPVLLDSDYIYEPYAIRDAAISAASNLIDFQNYQRIVLIVPQMSMSFNATGIGSIGCSQIYLDSNTSIVASVSWLAHDNMASENLRLNTAVHEMGHNLGLTHARSADFGDETLGPIGQLPAPFNDLREYGDCFSNMGSGGLGQWAAPHKYMLGWLEEGTDILSVETDGTFTLTPYEEMVGLKAIRVRRNVDDDVWLWLENRQAMGAYDSTLPLDAFTGALIHYEDGSWQNSLATNLLRFDFNGNFFDTAPLPSGSTWVDPYSRLTINVDRLQDGGLQASIAYSPPSVCPGSLSPSEFSIDSSGGTGIINVVAPEGCSWTVAPSVEWIQITSEDSGIGAGHVTFSISAINTSSDRWGKITVGSDFAIIIQNGLAGEVMIYPDSVEIPTTGWAGEIDVFTNTPDLEWSYSWSDLIQSIGPSLWGTVGPRTLHYMVGPNTTTEPRIANINVEGNPFTITQVAGGPAAEQIALQYLTPETSPPPRHLYSSAMFESRGELVLYGGDSSNGPLTDTWIWDGTNWQQVYPEHNPGTSLFNRMVYDAARDQIILLRDGNLYDGENGWSRILETWIWNGIDWYQVFPKNSPPGREFPAMAYDPFREKIVLFGGTESYFNGGRLMNDTWEWDGVNWTQKFSAATPSARLGSSMAYDQSSNELIMFGGVDKQMILIDGHWNTSISMFSDTWVWNGTEWRQKITSVTPPPRGMGAMGYDPETGKIFLMGGMNYIYDPSTSDYWGTYHVDTWIWDGSNWRQLFTEETVPPSGDLVAAYDPVHDSFFIVTSDDMRCASRGPKTIKLVVMYLDSDEDGTIDSIDECPSDPSRIIPNICGCGIPDSAIDIDTDEDGTLDCHDKCPSDPDKVVPGLCGCGVSDIDTDEDGTLDCHDECPSDPDKAVPGLCGCGVSACGIIRLEGNMSFGEVSIEGGRAQTLYIYNDGNIPLNVYDVTCPNGFECPENFSASIPPGENRLVWIHFAPTEIMNYSETVLVDSDKTIGENTINVTGIGNYSTKIIRIEGDMNFGMIDVGQSSRHPITIFNDGNYLLTLSNISCPSGFICPEDLDLNIWERGGSVTFDIIFTPATAGDFSGTIFVESDKTDGTPWINVTGRGFLDTDNDGLPDDWEAIYGLDPLIDDSRDDADGDGFSNLREYLQGTIPNDPLSYPPRAMPWLPLLLE